MTFSLYTTTVGAHLQILPSIVSLLDKAEKHCRVNGLGDEALTKASLAKDMWPFAMQVTACALHSIGAIDGVRAGFFGSGSDSAPLAAPPFDFASLRTNTLLLIAKLKAVDPDEINALVGRDMRFEFGTTRLDFTVEDFLLTFALPNFFFHATTAYDILRNQGLALGKMDFMGQMRLKM